MSQKLIKTAVAGISAAAIIAGTCVAALPAMAAPTEVSNANELAAQVQALEPGSHTIALSPNFEELTELVKLTVPAGVDLTLDSSAQSGTTVALAEGNSAKHMEIIAGSGSTLTIEDLHFEGHNNPNRESFSGEVSGGGVVLKNFTDVHVNNSSFEGNTGQGLSAGNPETLLIENTTIAGNHTGTSGAAFSVDRNTDATLRNSTIHNNRGDGNGYDGGAIHMEFGADLTVSNTLFTDNESGRRGGAIGFQNSEGTLTVTDSVFEGNEVTTSPTAAHTTYNDGGAISVAERGDVAAQTPTVRISGTTFDSNTAGDEAGAILAQGGLHADFVIENSTFVDNRSKGLDTASGSDSLSGGGAIEAYGTPITMVNNTLVRNVAERGNASGTQNGGAISITGGVRSLPAQNFNSAHNIFIGNQVLKADGTVDATKTTANVYGTSTKLKNLEGASINGLMTPAEGNTNVGLDSYKSIDQDVFNTENVFGTAEPQVATNGNTRLAGDPNAERVAPMTLLIAPNDGELVTGPADNIGAAVGGLTLDQRGLPMDDPADAGATQSAFVHFDPNGGDWADLDTAPFNGIEQVVRDSDEHAHIYRSATVGGVVAVPVAPDTAPESMEFAGWNSQADGSGETLGVQMSNTAALNQTWYAQWSDIPAPPTSGTITVKHVDLEGAELLPVQTISGKLGDEWSTEAAIINGYVLDSTQGKTSGEFTEVPVSVTFVYKKVEPTPTDPTPTPTDPTPTPTDPTPTPTDPTPTNPSPTPGETGAPTDKPSAETMDSSQDNELPKTGSAVPVVMLAGALMLLAAGGALSLMRRRHSEL